jgi:glutathione S-transferase
MALSLFHGGPQGHSAAALLALAEKGLECDSRRLDLAAFEQHGPAFLAINPEGQVPVLVHDGRILTEAFLILLYVEETWPDQPLGGDDPRARYQVQKWGKYVETHIAPNHAIAGWPPDKRVSDEARAGFARLPPERRALWEKAGTGFSDDERAAARAALVRAGARLAADLADGPWLAGDAFTLADIMVFPFAARFEEIGSAPSAAVEDWLERVRQRPTVREAFGEALFRCIEPTMGPEPGRWG